MSDTEHWHAEEPGPKRYGEPLIVRSKEAADEFREMGYAVEGPFVPVGAVADERQRIIERLLHAANLVDPDEVSRTAATLEKMAMLLTVEGGSDD